MADLDRLPAPDRQHRGGAGRLTSTAQGSHEKDVLDNINLTFNPATGANYPFTDVTRRAFPDFGVISMYVPHGSIQLPRAADGGHQALQQPLAGLGHLYALRLWDREAQPRERDHGCRSPSQTDLGGDWSRSRLGDQRHRAVINGIWEVGRGFQVSGLFYPRRRRAIGDELRGRRPRIGVGTRASACAPDGTIVPRNDFTQPPRKRPTCGSSSAFRCRSRRSLEGIAEVFNVFNSPNWTISTQESSRDFGTRTAGENRTAQVGFRITF